MLVDFSKNSYSTNFGIKKQPGGQKKPPHKSLSKHTLVVTDFSVTGLADLSRKLRLEYSGLPRKTGMAAKKLKVQITILIAGYYHFFPKKLG